MDCGQLIGCSPGSERVREWLSELAGTHEPPSPSDTKAFPASSTRPACEYWNWRSLGVSLCVEGGVVDAVHVYNNADGYAQFPGRLPEGLSWASSGRSLVEGLGEPSSKGGGGRAGNLILCYAQHGLQVQLSTASWEAPESTLACVTVFKPEPRAPP